MSYEDFNNAFIRARSMNGSPVLQAEMVRSGNIAVYTDRVAAVMLEWYANAPAEVQANLTGGGEINFPTSFPRTYGDHLRQVAEKRRAMVLYPWGTAYPVRLADYESTPGLMAAVTNPMVVPRDVLRTEEAFIIHFPFQGFLAGKRDDERIELRYQSYQDAHLHLRNFNSCDLDRRPELHRIREILLGRYGELKHGLRAIDAVENGWLIAQKLSAMLTVTHQEGGDPEYATYTEYGPFYPLDFLVQEDEGRYDFEYQWQFG